MSHLSQRFLSLQMKDFKIKQPIKLPRIQPTLNKETKDFRSERASINKLLSKKYLTDNINEG